MRLTPARRSALAVLAALAPHEVECSRWIRTSIPQAPVHWRVADWLVEQGLAAGEERIGLTADGIDLAIQEGMLR